MKYLLDTNVLISHLRHQNPVAQVTIQAGATISVITFAELLYGAEKSSKPTQNLKLITSMLRELQINIINLDQESAIIFAQLKNQLEVQGTKLEDFDLIIAATALTHHLTLLTHNKKHFKRIPNLNLA